VAAAPDDNGQPPEPEPAAAADESQSKLEYELKSEVVKHRRDARTAQQANDELRGEIERLRLQHESEQEKAIREAVEAKEAELRQEFGLERLHNRLRVLAAGRLRDPEDAVLHLGAALAADVDDAALGEALEQLLKERDYLAAPAAGVLALDGAGLVTQGARSTAPSANIRESSPDDWIRARAHGRR
jgi:TolA-binding protein